MRFKYEIGIITFLQFIILSLLSLANSLSSIIGTCVKTSGQCIENMIPSIILFILISVWFACVWILGYTVQDRRSRKLGLALVGAEFIIAVVALFSIKHHNANDWLSVITSTVDLLFALWIIFITLRLLRAGGGRVVARQRRRRRRPTADL